MHTLVLLQVQVGEICHWFYVAQLVLKVASATYHSFFFQFERSLNQSVKTTNFFHTFKANTFQPFFFTLPPTHTTNVHSMKGNLCLNIKTLHNARNSSETKSKNKIKIKRCSALLWQMSCRLLALLTCCFMFPQDIWLKLTVLHRVMVTQAFLKVTKINTYFQVVDTLTLFSCQEIFLFIKTQFKIKLKTWKFTKKNFFEHIFLGFWFCKFCLLS